MARPRLPPPFNDPEDDVVFHAEPGSGFRDAAKRELKPIPPAPKRRHATVAVLGSLVVIGMAASALVVLRMRPPTTPVAPPRAPRVARHFPPSPPTPTLVANGDPQPHRVFVDPSTTISANPTSIGFPRTEADSGRLTLDTNVPSQCIILGVSFHTPIENVLTREGTYRIACRARDGQSALSFDVTVPHNATVVRRDVVLAPIAPAGVTQP